MAAWQFDVLLVSQRQVQAHFGQIPLHVPYEKTELISGWSGGSTEAFLVELGKVEPSIPSWSKSITSWGDELGNRIDVVFEEQQIAEVLVRIDVRDISIVYLEKIAAIVRKFDGFILTMNGYLLAPSVRQLLMAINKSDAFRFVSDPESFFRELDKDGKT